MLNVLISGGTGLVGSLLSKKLLDRGYSVSYLSRSKCNDTSIKTYEWDYQLNYIDSEAIRNSDYIIHLAGASVVEKRWTYKQQQTIIDSRVKTANIIYNEVKKQNKSIKAFITASGVGYYGAINAERIAIEEDEHYLDFLGKVCFFLEKSAEPFKELGIRTIALRTGMVLSKNGGALRKLLPSFKWGVGSAIGTGKQYVAWIHINDLCDMFIKAIEDETIKGAYNAVAPEYVTNLEFSKTISNVIKKPFWLPRIPEFILKLALGKRAVILLKGMRVSSKKIIDSGFIFNFPTLNSALSNLLKNR